MGYIDTGNVLHPDIVQIQLGIYRFSVVVYRLNASDAEFSRLKHLFGKFFGRDLSNGSRDTGNDRARRVSGLMTRVVRVIVIAATAAAGSEKNREQSQYQYGAVAGNNHLHGFHPFLKKQQGKMRLPGEII